LPSGACSPGSESKEYLRALIVPEGYAVRADGPAAAAAAAATANARNQSRTGGSKRIPVSERESGGRGGSERAKREGLRLRRWSRAGDARLLVSGGPGTSGTHRWATHKEKDRAREQVREQDSGTRCDKS